MFRVFWWLKMENEELKRMSDKELEEQLGYLKKRLLTLQWDKSQNQLNAGMEPILERIRKELEETQQRINQIRKAEPSEEIEEIKEEKIKEIAENP